VKQVGERLYVSSSTIPTKGRYEDAIDDFDLHLNLSTTYCPDEIPTVYDKDKGEDGGLRKKARYIHIAMIDGEADYRNFELAVNLVKQHLEDGDMVLVNCDVAISRSVAVASTALAEVQSRSVRQCIGDVVDILGDPCDPAPELVEHAVRYSDG